MSKRSIKKVRHRTDKKYQPTFKESVKLGMILGKLKRGELDVSQATDMVAEIRGEDFLKEYQAHVASQAALEPLEVGSEIEHVHGENCTHH
jgi:hypothetical protein